MRWTEKRNFETILGAISSKILDVQSLITEEVELANYAEIYGDMRKHGSIASILKFPVDSTIERVVPVGENRVMVGSGKLGIIGAGNFASATIIPALQKVNAPIKYIASAQGLTAKVLAKKAKAENATSDYRVMLNDPEINTVIITTRHNLHVSMVMETLEAGKSVFVEKPLCLNEEELQNIENAYMKANDKITLTVGFNRRFSSWT